MGAADLPHEVGYRRNSDEYADAGHIDCRPGRTPQKGNGQRQQDCDQDRRGHNDPQPSTRSSACASIVHRSTHALVDAHQVALVAVITFRDGVLSGELLPVVLLLGREQTRAAA